MSEAVQEQVRASPRCAIQGAGAYTKGLKLGPPNLGCEAAKNGVRIFYEVDQLAGRDVGHRELRLTISFGSNSSDGANRL